MGLDLQKFQVVKLVAQKVPGFFAFWYFVDSFKLERISENQLVQPAAPRMASLEGRSACLGSCLVKFWKSAGMEIS